MPKPLDLRNYTPYYLSAISNAWTSTSSRLYLREFGIGITEWRVLASLRALGNASAMDAAKLTAMDHAAASRAITQLLNRDYIAPVRGRFQGRTKPFTLTPAGEKIYDAVRKLALKREAILLKNLSAKEQEQLLRLLSKVHAGLEEL